MFDLLRKISAPIGLSLLLLASWSSEAPAVCTPRVAEKLGIRFVEVCGDETGQPFWISFAPMPCSGGEHETIDCPTVTPLVAGESPLPLTSRRVAVVDAFSAHRLCGLRFAGHVATRAELERARTVLGLTALVVAGPASSGNEFRFEPLPEWTSDGACENPSFPGDRCRFARWPDGEVRHAPMGEIRACDARPFGPVEPGRAKVEVGGRCPAPGWSWDGAAAGEPRDLPCSVDLVGDSSRTDLALACRAPETRPPRAPSNDGSTVAGFRCVVPTWALATFEPPAARPDGPQRP